ncbi:hypothetical protein BH23PAT1_BH23PAT1_5160 [soil metagenome]
MFLIKEDRVLLAMKKRGFGAGRWNGVGGKPEPGESISQAAIRECQEEIAVTPVIIDKVAEIDFFYTKSEAQDQRVIVYLCKKWLGTPVETEEMAPEWFRFTEIPYSDMWPDDIYWLSEVLCGKKIKASFYLGEHDKVITHNISLMI